MHLTLAPDVALFSNRPPFYAVSNGVKEPRMVDTARFYTGVVTGQEATSKVRLHVQGGVLTGFIRMDQELFKLEVCSLC